MSTGQQFVGEVIDASADELIVEVKNRFEVGDSMELMTTAGNICFTLTAISSMNGQLRTDAPGSGFTVRIPKPSFNANVFPIQRALLIRNLPQHAG